MRCLGNNIKTTVNNLTVSYNDEGPEEAQAIIFIHGFPFNMCMWEKQVEALKDNYRVIAYDVRGHGDSDAGSVYFSIDLFANDLIELMDKLELDKAIICGLSMGGYIALNAIGKYPERFDALILSDTQCIADTPEIKVKRQEAIETINENGVENYADGGLVNLFSPASFINKKEEVAAVRKMIINTAKQSLCKTLMALSERKETCSKLLEIAVPVLIMVGQEDKITPPAASQLMHEKIKDSILNIIADAGHMANMENPSVFNDHLKQFLNQFVKKPVRLSAPVIE